MPTDTCQINQIDLASPGMVGRPAEANTGIDPIEALLGNGAPPLVEVVNVEPNHEVLREVLVIEALENELRSWSGRQRGKPARQRNSSLLGSARQLHALVRRRTRIDSSSHREVDPLLQQHADLAATEPSGGVAPGR